VIRQVFVTGLLVDAEREGLRAQQVAADAHHALRLGVLEEVEGGVDAEGSAAAQNDVGLAHRLMIVQ
jgi:hypothetical protein